ncbi:LLM class flavin-dependent oxidoreductase [Lentibacillus cibarius]|uniref:LLM class flavin-dependent oxidoreductase n=1 Tax=Lentibacillus cibarius TaxID=2583219 RepID=A0A5S3QHC0_9BACI|nr:LLM class flavin-dependent oxidoreductase [Lentibacillus cibarius]TMN21294.1 LLM class flavin-dependent oxidoreductase [Lentibacillus cibarius]
MKLSILDQSPISADKSAREALNASIDLAKTADRLGYNRYWIAEHHDMSGLACPNPDVMLGMIGFETKQIRIGAGAVLLPHYKPFRVAETYNLLATLYPGRVDLGIGRAPGGSAEASMALSGNFLENVRHMPESLDELRKFLHGGFPEAHMNAKIKPSPVPSTPPEMWLLGTSEKSAQAAAEQGLPYAFGQFMSKQDGPRIMQNYSETFGAKYPHQQLNKLAAISVICAETTEKAEELALSNQLWRIQQAKGEGDGKVPSVQEAKRYHYSDEDMAMVRETANQTIIGNPKEVKQALTRLETMYDTDEWMILTITHSYEARKRSYQLIADEILENS